MTDKPDIADFSYRGLDCHYDAKPIPDRRFGSSVTILEETAVTEQVELKPCPFCGWEFPYPLFSRSSPATNVICGNVRCEVEGPACESEIEAIEAWNQRPATDPAKDALQKKFDDSKVELENAVLNETLKSNAAQSQLIAELEAALKSAPLRGKREGGQVFDDRQTSWLKDVYRPVIGKVTAWREGK